MCRWRGVIMLPVAVNVPGDCADDVQVRRVKTSERRSEATLRDVVFGLMSRSLMSATSVVGHSMVVGFDAQEISDRIKSITQPDQPPRRC